MKYSFSDIEKKWQRYWAEHRTFETTEDPTKPKYYVLDMFPYPSGSGLHVGHLEGYTATDIVARFKRHKGFCVLHPMGWDAFGLPAEQYAIKTGTHPRITTEQNVKSFKASLQRLGNAYDWSREINTTDNDYVKWTQWIFLKLYERGLAYIAEIPVNWCEEQKVVLANEEVEEYLEKGFTVVRKPLRQWVLKITEYAERLLEDLDELDWSESIKEMQRNWIGKSRKAVKLNFLFNITKPRFAYSPHAPTRFSAQPTWCFRLNIRLSIRSRPTHNAPLLSLIKMKQKRNRIWNARACRRKRQAFLQAHSLSIR
jgi:leucyl-tRNA synthetase